MAAFRLALLLRRPVCELNISWDEFWYWQAFLSLEPPEEIDNMRFAALMAQITNVAGRSLPNGRSVTPDDFLGRKKRIQTPEEQIAMMRSLGRSK